MSTKIKTLIALIAGLGAAAAYGAGKTGAPIVTVSNHGDVVANGVEISGSGFNLSLGDIPPGQSVSRVIKLKGTESGLAIKYSIKGTSVEKADLAYLESSNGYCAEIELKYETVSTLSNSPLCFSFERLL